MSPEKLVYMANQIATFFQSQPGGGEIADFADHINKFWEPRMREEFLAIVASGGAGLKPLCIEAASHVRKPATA